MGKHPAPVHDLAIGECRPGTNGRSEHQRLDRQQPVGPLPITLGPVALETERVVAIGAHLTSIPKPRLSVAAPLAYLPCFPALMARSRGHWLVPLSVPRFPTMAPAGDRAGHTPDLRPNEYVVSAFRRTCRTWLHVRLKADTTYSGVSLRRLSEGANQLSGCAAAGGDRAVNGSSAAAGAGGFTGKKQRAFQRT
jgi:hypothetical protein